MIGLGLETQWHLLSHSIRDRGRRGREGGLESCSLGFELNDRKALERSASVRC